MVTVRDMMEPAEIRYRRMHIFKIKIRRMQMQICRCTIKVQPMETSKATTSDRV